MKQRNLLFSLVFVALSAALIYLMPRYPKPENLMGNRDAQVSESSDSLDALVEKALIELQKGENSPMESIMAIRRVLEIDPNHLKANFTLGALSFSTGQYQRAVERMKKVLEIDPDTEEAYKILAESYKNSGMIDSARFTIRNYKSRFPEGKFVQDFDNI